MSVARILPEGHYLSKHIDSMGYVSINLSSHYLLYYNNLLKGIAKAPLSTVAIILSLVPGCNINRVGSKWGVESPPSRTASPQESADKITQMLMNAERLEHDCRPHCEIGLVWLIPHPVLIVYPSVFTS